MVLYLIIIAFEWNCIEKSKIRQKIQVMNVGGIAAKNKNNEAKYISSLCTQPYEEPPSEDWIQPAKCLQWCHDRCSDYYDQGFFVSKFRRVNFLTLNGLKKNFFFDFF